MKEWDPSAGFRSHFTTHRRKPSDRSWISRSRFPVRCETRRRGPASAAAARVQRLSRHRRNASAVWKVGAPAPVTSLGVKMYRKETALRTRHVFMGMNPVRTEKETEGGDRYERVGGSGLGRSTNRWTIEPSERPATVGAEHLALLTVLTEARKRGTGPSRGDEESGRNGPRNRARERSRNDRRSHRIRQWWVTLCLRCKCEPGISRQSYREIARDCARQCYDTPDSSLSWALAPQGGVQRLAGVLITSPWFIATRGFHSVMSSRKCFKRRYRG